MRHFFPGITVPCHETDQACPPILFRIPRAELNTLKAEARLAEKKVKRLERALRGLRKGVDPYTPGPRYASPSQGAGRQD